MFCFSNVEILAVPTTSLIYNFGHLGTVDHIFVGEKRHNAMSALEIYPKINAAKKFINAGFKPIGNNFTLYPLIR